MPPSLGDLPQSPLKIDFAFFFWVPTIQHPSIEVLSLLLYDSCLLGKPDGKLLARKDYVFSLQITTLLCLEFISVHFDASVQMSLWNHGWKALWAHGLGFVCVCIPSAEQIICHTEGALMPIA